MMADKLYRVQRQASLQGQRVPALLEKGALANRLMDGDGIVTSADVALKDACLHALKLWTR